MKTQLAVHPLAAALLVAFAALTPIVRASVPAGPPVFTTPLSITNPYLPFQPGGIKVFSGNTGTAKALTVFDYLTDTRTFTLGGKTVECRILREMSFEKVTC